MTVDIQETHAVLRQLAELPIPLRDRLTDYLATTYGALEGWRPEDLTKASTATGIPLEPQPAPSTSSPPR